MGFYMLVLEKRGCQSTTMNEGLLHVVFRGVANGCKGCGGSIHVVLEVANENVGVLHVVFKSC